MELIRLPPSRVGQFVGSSYGTTITRSDSGLEDVVTTSCGGFGASFSVEWIGLEAGQAQQLIRWWKTVRVDSQARISVDTFTIPLSHPLWRNVKIKDEIQNSLLYESDLSLARWRAFEFSALDNPDACTLFNWSTNLVEVPGSHEYFF